MSTKPDPYPLRQRRSLHEKAKSEPDAEWRRFFLEVHHKRVAAEAEAGPQPQALNQFLETDFRSTGKKTAEPPVSKLAADLEWLRTVWPKLVGADVAEETAIFAFKNGKVTVTVQNNALLQEIRQFHKETIFQDLRDIWQGSMPLLEIAYRIGAKK